MWEIWLEKQSCIKWNNARYGSLGERREGGGRGLHSGSLRSKQSTMAAKSFWSIYCHNNLKEQPLFAVPGMARSDSAVDRKKRHYWMPERAGWQTPKENRVTSLKIDGYVDGYVAATCTRFSQALEVSFFFIFFLRTLGMKHCWYKC